MPMGSKPSGGEVNAQEARAERLEAVLTKYGITKEMLLAAVDGPFGHPLLVIATGSILQGFGNQRSDIDINAIVDYEVAHLPVPSHKHGAFLDIAYFGSSKVEKRIGDVRDCALVGRVNRDKWEQRLGDVFTCSRFAYGLILSTRNGWERWFAELQQPWLIARVAEWWQIEAIRRWLAGRWLVDKKPLLAAQRLFESVRAALESRAALAEQAYFGPKWLAEKLHRIGDRNGLELLNAVMETPTSQRDARDYVARCEATLEDLGVKYASNLTAQLWYNSGMRVRNLSGRTLVSRWNLRGLDISGRLQIGEDAAEPFWEGELEKLPPPDVIAFFVEDFAWLSVSAKES
jgi:hypothetical protein